MADIGTQKITTCLWFDTQGEDAAKHYVSIFDDSRILEIQRYGEAGPREAGTVMVVSFELAGQKFTALNGGPEFTFSEAISLQVSCESQEEIDELSARLTEGGEQGPCGWVKDKFGLSWQIFPRRLTEMIGDADQEKGQRAMKAMLGMKKIDLQAAEDAFEGKMRS